MRRRTLLVDICMIGKKVCPGFEGCKCWPGRLPASAFFLGAGQVQVLGSVLYRLEPRNVCFCFHFLTLCSDLEHQIIPILNCVGFERAKSSSTLRTFDFDEQIHLNEARPSNFGSLEAKADPRSFQWCFKLNIARPLPILKAHHGFHVHELPPGSPLPRKHNSLTTSLLELALHLAVSRQPRPEHNEFG